MDGIVSLPTDSTISVPTLDQDRIVSVPIVSESGSSDVISLSIMEAQNVMEADDKLDSSFESEKYETETKGYHLTPGRFIFY